MRDGAAPADVAALAPGDAEVALAACPPEKPEGALFGESEAWRFGAYAGGEEALVGECAAPDELAGALGERPALAHDAKALGTVPARLAFDTLIAAYLLDPARRAYALEELCEERGIGVDPSVEDAAARGAMLVHALAAAQRPQIEERGLTELLCDVELPLVRVLREMERIGLKLDKQRLAAIRTRVNDEVAALEREIWEGCGTEFMIGSPQQLAEVLFVKLGLSRKRRGKTGYSTDARVLQAIRHEHPVMEKIERWRELTKLESTYLAALPSYADARDRIHTTFSQVVAATGRLSSNDPNLQNIPIRTSLGREIRACFVAEPGNALLSIDYSQVELRILAHIAGEEVLKEIFRRGEDVHTATAAAILRVAGRAARRRLALEGEDGQLRDRLRPLGVRPVRPARHRARGGAGVHRPLPGRLPGGEGVHRDDDRAGDRGRVRDDPDGPPPPDPRAARAQPPGAPARRAARRQHGHPGHRGGRDQGRDGASRRRLARRGPRDETRAADPRRAAVRGARGRAAASAATLVVPEMVGALELDPPLSVDAGIGPNWLEAK